MEQYDEFAEFDDVDIEVLFDENNDDTGDAIGESVVVGESPANQAGAAVAVPSTSAKSKERKKQKKAIPRPQSTYLLQTAIDGRQQLLIDTLTAVSEDMFVSEEAMPLSPPVQCFAGYCKEKLLTAGTNLNIVLMHFAALLTLFWPTIQITEKHSLSSDRRAASLSAFFNLRIGDAMWEKSSTVFTSLAADIPHMFIQIFARILHEKLLENHERIPPQHVETPATELTRQEQNALRYTSGYIVSKLRRKIITQPQKEEMEVVLENMKKGSDKETRLSYTREWVETQSRGGLTMINDNTFLFFQEIEKLVRCKFPKTTPELRGMDLREGITESALRDRKILEKWTLLSAHSSISEQASLVFLQILIGFYTQVRGFSFAKNINERYKIMNKKQTKRSKGVRSALKRAEQESIDK